MRGVIAFVTASASVMAAFAAIGLIGGIRLNLTPYADYANAHMYPGGHRPTSQIAQITQALLGTVTGKPVVSPRSTCRH